DYLQDRGDPLGELIALQLERARTGARSTEREWELLQALERRPAGPLAQYLGMFALERGFVGSAMASPNLPPEIAHHPAWSTVSRIQMDSLQDAVLAN